jgi:class 3 adenylate cyclase
LGFFRLKLQPLSIGIVYLIGIICLDSCGDSQNQRATSNSNPVFWGIDKGLVIPTDSLQNPDTIKVAQSEPVSIKLKTFSISADERRIPVTEHAVLGKPVLRFPGKDSLSKPQVFQAKGDTIVALPPEVILVKQFSSPEINPFNFSSIGILQGMSNQIRSIEQDIQGNLWFGSYGLGVYKYDGKFLYNYTERHGLNGNSVGVIHQDKKGNIWIGTDRGLSKFNGSYFVNYDKLDTTETRIGLVRAIYEMPDGTIWFGAKDGGAYLFDGESFTHFGAKQGLSNQVYCITADKGGKIWFGTYGDGLFSYDGKVISNYHLKQGIATYKIYTLLSGSDDKLWIGGWGGGLSYIRNDSVVIFKPVKGLAMLDIWSLKLDSKGTLWIGTLMEGLCSYDGKYLSQFIEKDGLGDLIVYNTLEDRTGNLWIATHNSGVNLYMGSLFHNYGTDQGLSGNNVNAILHDSRNYTWLGYLGSGMSVKDNRDSVRYHLKWIDGLLHDNVYDFSEDKQGNIWMASTGGITCFKNPDLASGKLTAHHYTISNGLVNNMASKILNDQVGNIWFGTNRGLSKFTPAFENDGSGIFINYTQKSGLIEQEVLALAEDKVGNIWIASSASSSNNVGLQRFDGKKFTSYQTFNKPGFISDMMSDPDGGIWVAKERNLFRIKNDSVFRYQNQFSAEFPLLSSLLMDKKKRIWLGSRGGLFRLEHITAGYTASADLKLKMQHYGISEGFNSLVCYPRSIAEDHAGKIWVGSAKRLVCIDQSGERPDTVKPVISIQGLDIYFERIPWAQLSTKQDSVLILKNGVRFEGFKYAGLEPWSGLPHSLELPYNSNYLQFRFSGTALPGSDKLSFTWKLDGLDKEWNSLVFRNEVSYSNIPPGIYTLHLKALNPSGIWSDTVSYSFRIHPPWWRTWWAYFLYLILLVGSVAYYVRWRETALRRRQKELEITVEERTAEVVEQKNEAVRQYNRSEELLLNILPYETAQELKETGTAAARLIEQVTVLFTDFKGFTALSEKMSPRELVADLNECFSFFDKIMEKYGIEKIKTIGDAYMAAGGLPTPNITHATDVVRAAIEIRDFMQEGKIRKQNLNLPYFEIRIGVHTGPVVAGIVGIKKFQYDIWGDTVNTASRMESSGEIGKVNISDSTYQLVKETYKCNFRGAVEAKGKGAIEMYFVDHEI